METAIDSALPPCPGIIDTVSSAPFLLMLATNTIAPDLASCTHNSLPIHDAPPVTIAVVFLNASIISFKFPCFIAGYSIPM
jgi:hypothetical protein